MIGLVFLLFILGAFLYWLYIESSVKHIKECIIKDIYKKLNLEYKKSSFYCEYKR